MDKAYSVADQSYSGDITIVPPTWLNNLLDIFSNPRPERIAEFISTGERATWPKTGTENPQRHPDQPGV